MDAIRLSPPRRLSLPVNNRWGAGDMSVLDFGDASRPVDLIFVHANGFNAMTYRSLLAPLSGTLRIWAPDLRGHGLTRLPAEPGNRRSWTDHRDDLVALLEALDGPPAVLAGHSMGGTTALLAAAERPDRVSGLVLLDPVIWRRWVVMAFHLPLFDRAASRIPLVRSALRRRAVFDSRAQAMAAYTGRGAFRGWPEVMLADYLADGLIETDEGLTLACPPIRRAGAAGAITVTISWRCWTRWTARRPCWPAIRWAARRRFSRRPSGPTGSRNWCCSTR